MNAYETLTGIGARFPTMRFVNPTNGHVEEKRVPALWCFLFGVFYFLVSGIWVHALIMFLISVVLFASLGAPAILLVFVMDVIYCFFARAIVEHHYLRRGWEKLSDGDSTRMSVASGARKCPFCAEVIRYEAIKCRHCGSDLIVAHPAEVKPTHLMSDQELMAEYGITFDGKLYVFQEDKYDRLTDAVRFAKNLRFLSSL